VSRRDDQWLDDILAAVAAIAGPLTRGELDDGLVFDAVRVRLIEIGEAAKAIDPDLLAREPAIPWIDVAGIRNHRFTTAIVHSGWDRPAAGSKCRVAGRGLLDDAGHLGQTRPLA
jgi:uncharacterized protein with HEPN domain